MQRNYCPHQLIWRLHSIKVIMAQLITACFMQRVCKAGIHLSKKHSAWRCWLHCYKCTLLMMYIQRRNVIVEGSTKKSMRRASHINLPSSRAPSVDSKN
jgi:hypothetical protein